MEIRKLSTGNIEEIKFVIKETFSKEPWNDDLAILPNAQGRGCGSRFIDRIEEFIKEQGIVGIVLFTEKDIPAYGLYVKKSFEEKKERVFFEKHLR